MVSEIAEI